MNFLSPLFLVSAAFIIVPILVHLFYFKRYKKMDFTLVQYLKSIQEKNQSQRQVKHILILISRILFILSLVLAFAQPFFSDQKKKEIEGNIAIYIDNSYSLSSTDGNKRFEDLKQLAHGIIKQYPERSFILIDNQLDQSNYNLYDALNAHKEIDQMKLKGENLMYSNLESFLQSSPNTVSDFYFISDFQSSFAIEKSPNDKGYNEYWLPLDHDNFYNVSIDTVWLANPYVDKNQPVEILFNLKRNHANEELITKVNLEVYQQNRGFVNVDFKSNSDRNDTLKFQLTESGQYNCRLFIEDDGLQFDNEYFFNINVSDEYKVLVINDNSSPKQLYALFDQFDYFNYDTVSVNAIDYAKIARYDMVILFALDNISTGLISGMQNRLKQGKDMLIIPSANADLMQYNNLCTAIELKKYKSKVDQKKNLSQLNFKSSIFKSVFEEQDQKNIRYPYLNWYYNFHHQESIYPEMLIKNKEDDLLYRYKKGNSNVYQYAFNWDEDNQGFSDHALFPALTYNLILESKHSGQINYTVGKDVNLEAGGLDLQYGKSLNLESESGRKWMMSIKKIGGANMVSMNQSIENAGFYKLMDEEKKLNSYAFNVDRKESDLAYYSEEELNDYAKELNVEIVNIDESGKIDDLIDSGNSTLWKLCIILALLFLLIEIGLIKFL